MIEKGRETEREREKDVRENEWQYERDSERDDEMIHWDRDIKTKGEKMK